MSYFIKYFTIIVSKLDISCGIIAIIISALFAIISYNHKAYTSVEMSLSIFFSCIVYILFKQFELNISVPAFKSYRYLNVFLNIIFAILFLFTILFNNVFNSQFPVYSLLISILTAIIVIELYLNKGQIYLVELLLKIILISLTLTGGLFFQFPGLFGADAWAHMSFIEKWISYGHITPFVQSAGGYTGYAYFPIMHLLVIINKLLTSLDIKSSMFLTIGLANAFSLLFIFFIARILLNTKLAILGTIFISLSEPHLVWGVTLIPTSLGICFFGILIFLLIREKTLAINALLFSVLSIILIFTHTVSSFITATTLVLIYIASNIYKYMTNITLSRINIRTATVVFFCALMMAVWMNTFYYSSSSFFEAFGKSFVHAIQVDTRFVGSAVIKPSASPLNRIWFNMILFLTVLGALSWIQKDKRNNLRITFLIVSFGLSLLTMILPIFNISNLLPERWIYFVLILSTPLIAEGIQIVSDIGPNSVSKLSITVLILFIFCIFSINNSNLNSETPFIREHIRSNFIQSEFDAANSILKYFQSKIITDVDYRNLLFNDYFNYFNTGYLNPFNDEYGIILIRKYIVAHLRLLDYIPGPSVSGHDWVDYIINLSYSNYDLVYNNDDVKAYLKS